MLIGSSIVTTVLIPAAAFQEGGEATGAHWHTSHTAIWARYLALSTTLRPSQSSGLPVPPRWPAC